MPVVLLSQLIRLLIVNPDLLLDAAAHVQQAALEALAAGLIPPIRVTCDFLDILCYIQEALGWVFENVLLPVLKTLFGWIIATWILRPIGIVLWQLDRLLLFIGIVVAWFNELLILYVFTPGFTILAERFRFSLLPLVFTVVVFVLGVTYALAA